MAGVRSALDSARQALQQGSACNAACRRFLLSIAPGCRIALSDDDIGDHRLDDHRHLRELGCERFQGFLFAAPMPAADLARRYRFEAAFQAA